MLKPFSGKKLTSVHLFHHVQLFVTPLTAASQDSLCNTNSQSSIKLMSIELVMPSIHLVFCLPLSSCLQTFPGSGSFLMSWLFTSCGQSIRASVSASVLLMNIQDWSPLGWTGLVWSSTVQGTLKSLLQHHSSSAFSLLYGPTLTSIYDYRKNYSFDYTDLCWQSNVSAFLICSLGLSWLFF